jgi:hypothetical protein
MKRILHIITLISITNIAIAQLPKIEVVNARGRNIISWSNQYPSLASIEIQRSTDSTKNYKTIGTINKPKKGSNAFSDEKPLAGKNYYQLIIKFDEEILWYSSRKGAFVDSATLVAIANTPDTFAKTINTPPVIEQAPVFTYIPSAHVYASTYTGHISIDVENALGKKYSLVFFGNNGKEALRIDRISQDKIVLDKHNFNGKGIFSFKLYESGSEIEKGYVEIK